jgi:hypothetical protein
MTEGVTQNMKITFTPGPGVKVIAHSEGVIIKEPGDKDKAGEEVKRSEVLKQKEEQKGSENRGRAKLRRAEIKEILAGLNIRPEEIEDEQLAEKVRKLLHLIELLNEDNEQVRAEKQELQDAMNLLKGEQGKPKIKASQKKPEEEKEGDISSEQERKSRKEPSEKKSKAKKHKIKIDRTEICPVDKSILPDDAEFKGYQKVVVQELVLKTDNVEYKKEVYYSASQNKTYMGQLPPEIEGEFGPGIKTLVYTQKHVANMSEPKIEEFLKSVEIYISPATISRILTKNNEQFDQEKADIFQAGLTSSRYQQIDDTGAKVKGENQYVQIVNNPYYAAYFTVPRKDRLSVLDILNGGQPRSYLLNEEALSLLEKFGLSKKLRKQVQELALNQEFDEKQMEALLKQIYPKAKQGKNNRLRIEEAGAIAAYHQQKQYPVIEVLLSDDAPQYKQLTRAQGLCWIHEGRHYKKLRPMVPLHQEKLTEFRGQYWDYYYKLLDYRENPSPEQADKLSAEFDTLFATKTGYQALDERIAKTKAKKEGLLMVLRYPELPLHNNGSELEAKVQVRKRDVSLHTMSQDGTKANDTFLTIVRTAKKLDVSPYEYIYDRVSKRFRLPSLADLIKEKSLLNEGFFDTS